MFTRPGAIRRAAPDPLMDVAAMVHERFPRYHRERRHGLQRIVYLVQLMHVARHGGPLFADQFLSTCGGPEIPRLEADFRRHVPRCRDQRREAGLTPRQTALVQEVMDRADGLTVAQLASATQHDGTAWAARYRSGRVPLPIRIEDIEAEAQSLRR